MKNIFCKKSPAREAWAVSLCYAAATLSGLQAIHPGSCMWFAATPEQSFACDIAFATFFVFLGTFVAMRARDK